MSKKIEEFFGDNYRTEGLEFLIGLPIVLGPLSLILEVYIYSKIKNIIIVFIWLALFVALTLLLTYLEYSFSNKLIELRKQQKREIWQAQINKWSALLALLVLLAFEVLLVVEMFYNKLRAFNYLILSIYGLVFIISIIILEIFINFAPRYNKNANEIIGSIEITLCKNLIDRWEWTSDLFDWEKAKFFIQIKGYRGTYEENNTLRKNLINLKKHDVIAFEKLKYLISEKCNTNNLLQLVSLLFALLSLCLAFDNKYHISSNYFAVLMGKNENNITLWIVSIFIGFFLFLLLEIFKKIADFKKQPIYDEIKLIIDDCDS
ncbi:hypothetical protein [Limosilactobacillus vaginalis]|uniref:hypothetical protein n=1 Tax=Limosilactobacillus vaginalis TaxID=1633 RepID=UPI001F0959B3|nr:hypothetical protein [Limosilactobacillus vaginalis]